MGTVEECLTREMAKQINSLKLTDSSSSAVRAVVGRQCRGDKTMAEYMSTINRTKYIDDYCGQIDPLFNKADELTIAITKCQKILAEYLPPDSKVSKDKVISNLLGILADRNLVVLMHDLCGAK